MVYQEKTSRTGVVRLAPTYYNPMNISKTNIFSDYLFVLFFVLYVKNDVYNNMKQIQFFILLHINYKYIFFLLYLYH